MNMDRVLAQLQGAPEPIRRSFWEIKAVLEENPYPKEGSSLIMPFKGTAQRNMFTAPFGDGLLAYQVMVDQPLIDPLYVIWA
jgi:hypothetical protein